MMEPTLHDLRTRLDGALSELAQIGELRESCSLRTGSTALAKKLSEQRFVVAVVGEFKRGKSTFINALLGAELLPVGVLPLTSVVTVVGYGPEQRAEVVFENQTRNDIPLDEVSRYVTERHNPGNRLGVRLVNVMHPVPELADGVQLVDTPGVGSVHHHNTSTTRAFLSEVDAAIFLASADQPVSHSEREFLHEVREEAARMFFVLNKVDFLGEDETDEAVQFARNVLEDALDTAVTVYPVSAVQALRSKQQDDEEALEQSGFTAFERDFHAFLLYEKGQTILTSLAGSAQKLINDEMNALRVEEASARLPAEDLARRSDALEDVFGQVTRSRRDMDALVAMEIERLIETVEEDLADLRRRESDRLLDHAQSLLRRHPDPRSAAGELNRQVEASLRDSIDSWRADEEEKVAATLRQATNRFLEDTNGLVRSTIDLCSQLFEIDLAHAVPPEPLTLESQFAYTFFNPPASIEITIEAVRRRLPSAAARRMLSRTLDEDIPILVDKQCGRLRWNFTQQLEKSRRALTRELDERLNATMDGLRRGIERARERQIISEQEAGNAQSELDQERQKLQLVAATLLDVKRAVS